MYRLYNTRPVVYICCAFGPPKMPKCYFLHFPSSLAAEPDTKQLVAPWRQRQPDQVPGVAGAIRACFPLVGAEHNPQAPAGAPSGLHTPAQPLLLPLGKNAAPFPLAMDPTDGPESGPVTQAELTVSHLPSYSDCSRDGPVTQAEPNVLPWDVITGTESLLLLG